MSATVLVTMKVNGDARRLRVPPMKRLLDVLREDCGLTGSKEGCGEGECGACTVLLNGAPVNACLIPAIHAEGATVVTVEGLARGGKLATLQRAFAAGGAAQCGMCTPGMLVTASAFLASTRGRVPGEDEVRRALSGTLCRCTGYQKIVDSVRAAAAADVKPARKAVSANRASAKRAPAAKQAAKRAPAAAAQKTAKKAAKQTVTKTAKKPAKKSAPAKKAVGSRAAAPKKGRR